MLFFQRHKGKIILIAVTVLLVLVMALSAIPSAKPNFVSNAVNVVLSPVQKVISKSINSTQSFFSFMFNMDKYENENKVLSEKISALEKELRETEELKKENTRLRAMLEMRERTFQYEIEAAEVIAKEAGNWFNSFTIDKGTSDGVAVHNPVITSSGLVGYVSEAGPTYSKVVSIIDSTSSVAATVKRTGDSAVVEGDLKLQERGLCRMVYVNKNSVITAGDDLETSGMGGIYPRDLYIGKIKEVSADGTGLSQQAIIEPAVNFDSISEVFVITGVK